MAVSEVLHNAALKRLARTGHIPAGVQHRRDRAVGVLIEKLVDQRDDVCAGLTKLPGVERLRQRACGRRATSKADVRGHAVGGLDQRDIVDEQAHHAFPFTIGRVRIVP